MVPSRPNIVIVPRKDCIKFRRTLDNRKVRNDIILLHYAKQLIRSNQIERGRKIQPLIKSNKNASTIVFFN